MDWLLYIAFAPFLMPLVLIGVGMTGVEVYQFFRRNPRLGRNEPTKALFATFIVVLVSLLVLFVPRVLGAFLVFQYITAFVTLWYFCCSLYFVWKWGRIIMLLEDMDPDNDPQLPGTKCGAECKCSCHGKKAQITSGTNGDGK